MGDIKTKLNNAYQQALKKLGERKSFLDKVCDSEIFMLTEELEEMMGEGEEQLKQIESAYKMAMKSSNMTLEGETMVVRDSLASKLKNILAIKDPDSSKAKDISKYVKGYRFQPIEAGNDFELGDLQAPSNTSESSNQLNPKIESESKEQARLRRYREVATPLPNI